MRALFLHLEREWSGCARAFVEGARGLAARGHEVTLVCAEGSAMQVRVAGGENLQVVVLPEGSTAGDAWRLRTLLRDRSTEVAFVHSEAEQLAVAGAMKLADGGAVIRRIPMGIVCTSGRAARFASRIAHAGLLFASARDQECAEGSTGYALGSFIAPLGVEVSEYENTQPATRAALDAPARSRIIACVYEPRAKARLSTVFRTMAVIAPRHPELHLVLVGPGSDDEDVRMHAAALGINNVVSHLGEREDRRAILAAAEVGWVAAENDAAAYGFLDLMALGIPTLSERGEIPERFVADGITGSLIAPGDPSETAAAVAAFMAREEQRAAMGRAGRTRVAREFPRAAMIDGFEAALQAARQPAGRTSSEQPAAASH